MTNLERRALLGDREAQAECTAKGIVLPCPCCGGGAKINLFLGTKCVTCTFCPCAIIPGPKSSDLDALVAWNTRPKPSVGRCKTCVHWSKSTLKCFKPIDDEHIFHDTAAPIWKDSDFCSYYEPKEATP